MKSLTALIYRCCLFIIILFSSLFFVTNSKASAILINKTAYTDPNDSIKIGSYLIEIISSVNGYGYNIYKENKLRIHQPFVPAMQGNIGFTSKAAAEKVAQKVVEKLKNGEQLPTISINEMKVLGALPQTHNTQN